MRHSSQAHSCYLERCAGHRLPRDRATLGRMFLKVHVAALRGSGPHTLQLKSTPQAGGRADPSVPSHCAGASLLDMWPPQFTHFAYGPDVHWVYRTWPASSPPAPKSVELYDAEEVSREMAWGTRYYSILWRPSVLGQIAPRAISPWYEIPWGDGSVTYIHRQRERLTMWMRGLLP